MAKIYITKNNDELLAVITNSAFIELDSVTLMAAIRRCVSAENIKHPAIEYIGKNYQGAKRES